ncbi:mRNA biogenesis factor [Rhizoctonia solani AG-3 Rhs1AP]|uniref:mRNA biogenesis factor n=1 Tax=Rhizoctonia solani AG-3 Rhs1AP TaxID=1086054 RepID=X8JVK8_9AGAM|nr:mRNA biogenesis factor [Rhizoctonia solani AG-3 Rhs1AP]
MAKGKTSNPADAFRKAQRAKELKKEALETEIHELQDIGEDKLSSAQKERLKELRAEVTRIRKVKQDYVTAHPEQSHLVRGLEPRARRLPDATAPSAGGSQATPAVRSIFGKNGLPIRPERSIYYDPVLNPYGMPPPGMPYVERALLPHEIEQDSEQRLSQSDALDEDSVMDSADSGSDEELEDDDIVLPAGPPPSGTKQQTSDSESDSDGSDDDIPMPTGPPPPKSAPLPKGPPPVGPPFPPAAPYGAAFPPFPPNAPLYAQPHSYIPPPPPGFPTTTNPLYPPPFVPSAPYPQQTIGRELKPRDRQLAEAVRVVQDPLSSVPHITYQAHQAQRHQLPTPPSTAVAPPVPSQHGLPPKPGGASRTTASATISAEPELRDLKKEATAFVPTSMRRATKKGPNANPISGLHINAAPNEDGDQGGPSAEPRKDLMSVLGSQLGVADKPASGSKAGQGKDDYENFLAEVGSFL